MLISKQCSSVHEHHEHCLTRLSFDFTNDFGVSYKANEPKPFSFTKYCIYNICWYNWFQNNRKKRRYLKISNSPKKSDCLLQTVKRKNTSLCSTENTKQFAGECQEHIDVKYNRYIHNIMVLMICLQPPRQKQTCKVFVLGSQAVTIYNNEAGHV